MHIYILFGIAFLGFALYRFLRNRSRPELEKSFISTQSQSNERIAQLHLDNPSDDVSSILAADKLSFPEGADEIEELEYTADPEIEWIVNIILPDGTLFRSQDLNALFDFEWRTKYPSTIFGYSVSENKWVFADTGDTYSQLQIVIPLLDAFQEDSPNDDPKRLNGYIEELEKRFKVYPSKIQIQPAEPLESAMAKSKRLEQWQQEFNQDAIIVLQADNKFSGEAMWDTLTSLGLQWGDGDLFHWNNFEDYGHDQHFSVWTTTAPGFFFPEEIKKGRMNPQNLVFGFSIPRSADPAGIFDIMFEGVTYCQNRLGGQILDKNLQPFHEEKEKQELLELLKKMQQRGLTAGSAAALRMF